MGGPRARPGPDPRRPVVPDQWCQTSGGMGYSKGPSASGLLLGLASGTSGASGTFGTPLVLMVRKLTARPYDRRTIDGFTRVGGDGVGYQDQSEKEKDAVAIVEGSSSALSPQH